MDVEGLVMIGLVTISLSDVLETLQQQKCIEDLTPPIFHSLVGGAPPPPKKKKGFCGNFSKGGWGLLNSQNIFKCTKLFLVCQNHSYVTKHVLQY